MGNVYYIGGSFCSGKSTLARRLADRYAMSYYCFDDYLDEYMDLGARKGDDYLKNAYKMYGDALWMREPSVMAEESAEIFRRIYRFCYRDIRRLSANGDVIVEGAGFMPELTKKDGIAADRYLCLVSSSSFERAKYEDKNFIRYVLAACSDAEAAKNNWMERDSLFAVRIKNSAEAEGYTVLNIDGTISEDRLQAIAEEHFGLKAPKTEE